MPIGQIRYDLLRKDNYLITFSIDKIFRNKGYGVVLIKESLIRLLIKILKKFIAQVRPKNLSSIKVFEKMVLNLIK